MAIMVVVGFSGPMAGFTQDNASRVLSEAGSAGAEVNETASAYVAANVASGLGISVADQVNEHTESLSSTAQMLAGDQAFLRKASAVSTDTLSYQDIETYTAESGETISDVAKKFGIKSETIREANGLSSSDSISAGEELTILPVDGVLHEVEDGDTAESLAEHYDANAAQIISFNDAEVGGLDAGQRIVIPGGTEPAPAPSQQYSPSNSYFASTFTSGYSGNASYRSLPHPGNGASTYDYGWCTFWAAYRAGELGNPVPDSMGNASAWSGTRTSPVVGAVAQSYHDAGGMGHVAVVEAVSEDGSKIKYSDMNGLAGFNRAAETTDWVPASRFPSYLVFN